MGVRLILMGGLAVCLIGSTPLMSVRVDALDRDVARRSAYVDVKRLAELHPVWHRAERFEQEMKLIPNDVSLPAMRLAGSGSSLDRSRYDDDSHLPVFQMGVPSPPMYQDVAADVEIRNSAVKRGIQRHKDLSRYLRRLQTEALDSLRVRKEWELQVALREYKQEVARGQASQRTAIAVRLTADTLSDGDRRDLRTQVEVLDQQRVRLLEERRVRESQALQIEQRIRRERLDAQFHEMANHMNRSLKETVPDNRESVLSRWLDGTQLFRRLNSDPTRVKYCDHKIPANGILNSDVMADFRRRKAKILADYVLRFRSAAEVAAERFARSYVHFKGFDYLNRDLDSSAMLDLTEAAYRAYESRLSRVEIDRAW